MKRLSLEQLLGLDKFQVDDDEAHIKVNNSVCSRCERKPCTFACPAGVYSLKDGEICVDDAGCVECGTCRVVCPYAAEAIDWNFPRGGFGVSYRYG